MTITKPRMVVTATVLPTTGGKPHPVVDPGVEYEPWGTAFLVGNRALVSLWRLRADRSRRNPGKVRLRTQVEGFVKPDAADPVDFVPER